MNFVDGTRICDFLYESYKVYDGENPLEGLPHAFKNNDDVETLEITLKDNITEITMILSYTVFYERDVITRSTRLFNNGTEAAVIEKLMSFNIDFKESDFEIMTLDGKWIRERHINIRKLKEGTVFYRLQKRSQQC